MHYKTWLCKRFPVEAKLVAIFAPKTPGVSVQFIQILKFEGEHIIICTCDQLEARCFSSARAENHAGSGGAHRCHSVGTTGARVAALECSLREYRLSSSPTQRSMHNSIWQCSHVCVCMCMCMCVCVCVCVWLCVRSLSIRACVHVHHIPPPWMGRRLLCAEHITDGIHQHSKFHIKPSHQTLNAKR